MTEKNPPQDATELCRLLEELRTRHSAWYGLREALDASSERSKSMEQEYWRGRRDADEVRAPLERQLLELEQKVCQLEERLDNKRAIIAESDANANRLKRTALELELAESRRLSCERHERADVLALELREEREAHAKTRAELALLERQNDPNSDEYHTYLTRLRIDLEEEREAHAQTRAELDKSQQLHASCREMMCERERELNSSRAKHDIYKAVAKETVAKLRGELGEANSQCTCTPAERKVLEAMAGVPTDYLRQCVDNTLLDPAIEAELALRGEKP